MKHPVKSIGIFVCGAAIASLPYTLSIGKANAQTTTSSTSNSNSKNASSSAQANSSQYSSSSSSKNASASDMAQQFARAGQSSSSNGSGELPIMALSNDDQFVYAAVGNTIYRVRKSEMSSLTLVPPRRADPKP